MTLGSRKRHIAKTVTWRVVGTIDTMVLSWVISGNPLTGLQIGGSEVITKMGLYYLHERLWFKTRFLRDSQKRHIVKSITWRCIGTVDTMLIAWFMIGNPLTGMKIGMAEVVTKMFLYYLHERIWYRFNYGLENREDAEEYS